ncbi:MAG: hypothetical protein JNL37_13755 [Thauera sp.]|nr:hypothetical protein [Thauera sp.]
MSDTKKTPDCAHDNAAIAVCVLNQLLALASSIRKLSATPGESCHVPHLADLAVMHAMDWVEHFEEQVALHVALDNEKKGANA